jgi:hypothetical protein
MTIVSGIGIATGWQELSGTPAPPSPCAWVATFENYPSYGVPPLFADAALTIPLWSDPLGNGYLRTLMNSMGGDVYLPYTDTTNFNFGSLLLYYYGTSDMPIDVYDGLGNLSYTIYFQKLTPAYAASCQPDYCYEATFDKTYGKLARIYFNGTATALSAEMIASPPDYAPIDVFLSTTSMQQLVNWIYGASALYSIVDNGATYTVRFENCYYWGMAPIMEVIDASNNILNVPLSSVGC